MGKSNKEVIKKIKKLPPLNMVAQQLLEVTNKPTTSAEGVTKVLSNDQAIASKVLELVNSSFYGFPRRISTISRAVVILGNKGVQNLALAFACMEALNDSNCPLKMKKFWRHSVSVATASQLLAARLKYPVPEEAFISGLLHDIGILALAILNVDDYKEILRQKNELLHHEKEKFGANHCQVGSQLMDHWKLPEKHKVVCENHHGVSLEAMKEDPLLKIVVLAETLAVIDGYEFIDNADADAAWPVIHASGIPLHEYVPLLNELRKRIMMTEKVFNLTTKKADYEMSSLDHRKQFLVLGKDGDRVIWLRGLLKYFDFKTVTTPLEEIADFANPDVGFALVDTVQMSMKEIQALVKFLGKKHQLPTGLVTDSHFKRNEAPTSVMPLAFGIGDLNRAFPARNAK